MPTLGGWIDVKFDPIKAAVCGIGIDPYHRTIEPTLRGPGAWIQKHLYSITNLEYFLHTIT